MKRARKPEASVTRSMARAATWASGTRLARPSASRGVLRERADVGVDQQVGIDEDHRNRSPSATASASATSSRLPSRHRPRSAVGVR